MNFRKFISGVSALTIAASAFAAMTVTASAEAEAALNWTVVDDVVDEETGDVTTATPWTKDGGAKISASGNTVSVYSTDAGNRNAVYAFDSTQTYTSGIVNVAYTLNLSSNNGVKDRSGASVAIKGSGKNIVDINASWPADMATTYQSSYNVVAGDQTDDITINSGKNYTVNISVNLDDHTVSYKVAGDGNTVEQKNVAIDESIANVNTFALKVPRGGASFKVSDLTIENIKNPVKSITVNYKDSNGNVKLSESKSVDGLSIGDSYTYIATNYIKGTDGNYYYVVDDVSATKWYSTRNTTGASGNLKQTVTLKADNNIDYTVKAVSGDVVYYSEGEDIDGFNTVANASSDRYICSGGEAGVLKGKSNGPAVSFFEVEKTGTYQIIVGSRSQGQKTALYKSASDANSFTDAILSLDNNNTSNGAIYVTTVALNKGDNLTFKGLRKNSGDVDQSGYIDYVVIKNIPATAELTGVEAETYSTADGYDKDTTAAKLYVTVANGPAKIKVTYKEQDKTTATAFEGNVVLGAILEGGIDAAPSFAVSAVVE